MPRLSDIDHRNLLTILLRNLKLTSATYHVAKPRHIPQTSLKMRYHHHHLLSLSDSTNGSVFDFVERCDNGKKKILLLKVIYEYSAPYT